MSDTKDKLSDTIGSFLALVAVLAFKGFVYFGAIYIVIHFARKFW